jgi:RNA polymerase sigma factor (sigma-70 family)
MDKKNKTIDDKIKEYDPMIASLLRNYKITFDYEDLFQEMRIVVWKVLTSENENAMWKDDSRSKFSTYLYHALANRLKNILKVDYKIYIKPAKDAEGNPIAVKLTKDELNKRKLANPNKLEDLSFEQKRSAFEDANSADTIRLNVDIDLFEDTLTDDEKRVWHFKLEAETQRSIAEKMGWSLGKTNKVLKKVTNSFKKFIDDGEL